MQIETIELKDFVQKTLEDVVSAIDEFNKKQSVQQDEFFLDNITSKGIHFDLAVTISSTSEKDGKARFGIKVLEIGGEASKAASSESTNRIKFNITYKPPKANVRKFLKE
ncbi:MAG: hypothetical protein ACD_26C00145G0003 [uncultured bacterium]|nr:MAG: hypothetical protein ACD_26C00145G0003 [uncultured bacterium]